MQGSEGKLMQIRLISYVSGAVRNYLLLVSIDVIEDQMKTFSLYIYWRDYVRNYQTNTEHSERKKLNKFYI